MLRVFGTKWGVEILVLNDSGQHKTVFPHTNLVVKQNYAAAICSSKRAGPEDPPVDPKQFVWNLWTLQYGTRLYVTTEERMEFKVLKIATKVSHREASKSATLASKSWVSDFTYAIVCHDRWDWLKWNREITRDGRCEHTVAYDHTGTCKIRNLTITLKKRKVGCSAGWVLSMIQES